MAKLKALTACGMRIGHRAGSQSPVVHRREQTTYNWASNAVERDSNLKRATSMVRIGNADTLHPPSGCNSCRPTRAPPMPCTSGGGGGAGPRTCTGPMGPSIVCEEGAVNMRYTFSLV